MSIGSFLGTAIRGVNSLDNRYRKRVAKNAVDLVAEATDSNILRNTSRNIKNTPLSQFENKEGMLNSMTKAGAQGMVDSFLEKKSTSESNDIKEQEAPKQESGEPSSSGDTKTSTVSNNKTNTMQNNNTNTQPTQQYNPPQNYDDWRNRRTANGDTYNAVFEDATNRLLANPDSFTQEQKNAIRDMGVKLGYFQDTPSTQPVAQQINNASDSYYSVQGRPQFGFSL